MMSILKISTNACWALASATTMSSGPKFRMFKRVPFSRWSLAFSHASLVVRGSVRGSNEASTVFAF
jgi:hypothetical protein